jgi:hypothetical protein
MAPVAQGLGPSFVVAMGDGADPAQAVASVFNDLLGGFALCKQPHDLPVASRNRIFRLAIAGLDLFEAQVRVDRQMFLHDSSIQQEMVSQRKSIEANFSLVNARAFTPSAGEPFHSVIYMQCSVKLDLTARNVVVPLAGPRSPAPNQA